MVALFILFVDYLSCQITKGSKRSKFALWTAALAGRTGEVERLLEEGGDETNCFELLGPVLGLRLGAWSLGWGDGILGWVRDECLRFGFFAHNFGCESTQEVAARSKVQMGIFAR